MKKLHVLILSSIFVTQSVLASDIPEPCFPLAKACFSNGYARNMPKAEKRFWDDCMYPILLGKSVNNINVSASEVQGCRASRIQQLNDELSALQAVDKNQ